MVKSHQYRETPSNQRDKDTQQTDHTHLDDSDIYFNIDAYIRARYNKWCIVPYNIVMTCRWALLRMLERGKGSSDSYIASDAALCVSHT